jgi:hypothetical protein
MNDEIGVLEEKILDLEFKQLKKQFGWDRRLVTATKTIPAKKTTLEMRVSSRGSAKMYELRTGSTWRMLPEDRSQWPADARAVQDRVDAIYKERTRDGRLISAAVGSVSLG